MEKANKTSFLESVQSCDKVMSYKDKYPLSEFPKVSIVIPTRNDAQLIAGTLESILVQDYPSFEIIVVDSSEDRTVETIKNYHSDKIRIFSVSKCRRYEMLNKGLSQASGKYVNFLFPGDFYIYKETLKYMMLLALENKSPQMIFCGTLLRDGKSDVKILYRPFNLELLKKGQQPTSLQSCWFRKETLKELGKFNPNYSMRGGYELMCRFALKKEYRVVSANRVLIDYDLRSVTRRMVLTHFWETLRTVQHFFGFMASARWLAYQNEMRRFMKLWLHSLKVAFYGR